VLEGSCPIFCCVEINWLFALATCAEAEVTFAWAAVTAADEPVPSWVASNWPRVTCWPTTTETDVTRFVLAAELFELPLEFEDVLVPLVVEVPPAAATVVCPKDKAYVVAEATVPVAAIVADTLPRATVVVKYWVADALDLARPKNQ
jgi:hypothetical protein